MTIGPPAGQRPGAPNAIGRTGEPLVLFCNCAHYDVISKASRDQILRSLSQARLNVEAVSDLCGLAANRDPRLQSWVQASSLAIVACFPRAVRWLFHAAGMPLAEERVRFFNMRTQSPDEIIEELMKDDGSRMIEDKSALSASNHPSSIIHQQSAWVPWFPVIDYGRCVNCKQCLNFCLFGVYGQSAEDRVEVHKPSGCKTNCPACARMCPQQAIIFPKYADSPINGDECPGQTTAEKKPVVAGDVYERIRSRSAGGKRFSTQTNEPSPTRSCPTLDSLRRELNIPDDVLASLSPAEMQRIIKQSKPQSSTDAGKKGDEHHE